MHRGNIEVEGTPAQLTETVPSAISFGLGGGVPALSGLPDLPGTATHLADGHVTITTSHLQRDTLSILQWADQHSVVSLWVDEPLQ